MPGSWSCGSCKRRQRSGFASSCTGRVLQLLSCRRRRCVQVQMHYSYAFLSAKVLDFSLCSGNQTVSVCIQEQARDFEPN